MIKVLLVVSGVVGLIISIIAVHELAHYVVALSLGAPADQVIFHFDGINPSADYPNFGDWRQSATLASCGLLTGGAMLAIWVCVVRKKMNVWRPWAVGSLAGAAAAHQIANDLTEWLLNDAYQEDAVPYYLAALLGVGLHLALTRFRFGVRVFSS